MADFQNVGNFDAGVFTPKLGGVAPSGSSFTMDAAGIASGGAFLTSELEKRDPLIRKPLTSVMLVDAKIFEIKKQFKYDHIALKEYLRNKYITK